MEKRNNLSEKIYSSLCHPLPGIDDVLKKLKSENFTTAVASSTSLGRINVIVNRFNWKKYFNQLISAQGMPFSGKPEPDVYLYSAKLLGVNPKSCLVFEDSVNGVLSAKAAGMFCVGIPNPKWNTSRLEKADFVIDSFFDNKVNEILGI
jgi:HAD superfamily hydrolase (TIGR01509 family)